MHAKPPPFSLSCPVSPETCYVAPAGVGLIYWSCPVSSLSASDLILMTHSLVRPVLHGLHLAKWTELSEFTSACHRGLLALPHPTHLTAVPLGICCVCMACRLCCLVVAADVYAPLTLQVQRVPEQPSTAMGIVAAL